MPELCSILFGTDYAQNYTGIIASGLAVCKHCIVFDMDRRGDIFISQPVAPQGLQTELWVASGHGDIFASQLVARIKS